MTDKEIRNWAALIHISAFSMFLIPLGNIFVPLLLWMLKKEESDFITFHAKEAINFQITITLAMFVAAILVILIIGLPLLLLFGFLMLVFPVIAAVRAIEGEFYNYPFTIKFI